jgi:hypothetical protein
MVRNVQTPADRASTQNLAKRKLTQPRASHEVVPPSKSDLIRANPELSAVDVVSKAKALGIAMTTAHVYSIRSRDAKRGVPTRGRGRPPKSVSKNANKSSFVRSQPASMSAAEVVAAAKKEGLSVSTQLVYLVRGKGANRASGQATTPAKAGAVASAQRPISDSLAANEREFARLLLDIGFERGEQIVARLRRALSV